MYRYIHKSCSPVLSQAHVEAPLVSYEVTSSERPAWRTGTARAPGELDGPSRGVRPKWLPGVVFLRSSFLLVRWVRE